ncbi:hypothetical protein [Blastococcus capsensis]|uniref:hypothetical protein n=1 Tax=Blastococcus capsensis TaxID=1564163 RepID=UPI0025400205|nr:hypothetical protein [Blastococcus capsensis]MDK3257097.1 hypothetical protein [Blastococcus capsensis]
MDLNEAAQRIFKYHWVLILVTVIVGISIPLLLSRLDDDAYAASARLVIGSADARDGQEANALADTALAVATSPEAIAEALQQAGVDREPSAVAGNVRVDPVGSSGVLELSVTDADPQASAEIANALATEIVERREDAVFGNTQALLAETDERIAALTETVRAIEAEADAAARAEAAARAVGAPLGTGLAAIALRHDQAVTELGRAQAQRQDLAQSLAESVRPQVVDASAGEGSLVATGLPARLAVGGLLGLILGVALAATLEAFRPTLSPAALARHLDVQLLGNVRRLPRGPEELTDKWLASYVNLAADGAGVRSFELVPVGPQIDVRGLARGLAADSEQLGSGKEIVPVVLDGPHDSHLPARLTQPGTGIVVVAPRKVQAPALASLERHVALTRQPVIGVIGYGSPAGAAPQQRDSVPGDSARRPVEQDPAPTAAASSS